MNTLCLILLFISVFKLLDLGECVNVVFLFTNVQGKLKLAEVNHSWLLSYN